MDMGAGGLFACGLGLTAFIVWKTYLDAQMTVTAQARLRSRLFRTILYQEMMWHETGDHGAGIKINASRLDVDS